MKPFNPIRQQWAVLSVMFAVVGATSNRAEASAINSFNLNSSTNGNYISLSAGANDSPPGANQFTDPISVFAGTAAPAANINATVTDLISTASWTIQITNEPGTEPTRDYFFTVNLLNNVVPQHPIGPVFFNLTNGSLNLAASGIVFATTPTPTSNYNSYNNFDPGATTNSQLYFGGLRGGGGEFYNGQTGTLTFTVTIPTGLSGTFGFSLTATPEPTSLVLGSIGMVAMGGIGWMRRRKQPVVTPPTEPGV